MEKSGGTGGGSSENATKTVSGSSSVNVTLHIDTDESKIMAVVNKNVGNFTDRIAGRIAASLAQLFMNKRKGGL